MKKYVIVVFLLISGYLFSSEDKKTVSLSDFIHSNKEGRICVVKPIKRDKLNIANLFSASNLRIPVTKSVLYKDLSVVRLNKGSEKKRKKADK